MNQTELNSWGLDVTKQIYQYWLELAVKNIDIKKNGFAVFYSPLIYKPKYLFIGINPGGKFRKNDKPFKPEDIISELPKKHDYLFEDYDIAKAMRDLFSFNQDIIKKSVKFNFYFFRTPSAKELHNLKEYNEIFKFCAKKTINIIETLQPVKIMTEGLGVYDMLYDLMKFETNELPIKTGKYRLIETATKDNQTLIGMIHPSGARTRRRFTTNMDTIISNIKIIFDEK